MVLAAAQDRRLGRMRKVCGQDDAPAIGDVLREVDGGGRCRGCLAAGVHRRRLLVSLGPRAGEDWRETGGRSEGNRGWCLSVALRLYSQGAGGCGCARPRLVRPATLAPPGRVSVWTSPSSSTFLLPPPSSSFLTRSPVCTLHVQRWPPAPGISVIQAAVSR